MLTDLYVRNKETGKIHKVGTDHHDSLWVDNEGIVHYMNLQSGDGCGKDNSDSGYEFVKTDCGFLPEYSAKEEIKDFEKLIN